MLNETELLERAFDEKIFAVDGQKIEDRAAAIRLRADAIEGDDERTLHSMGWSSYTADARRFIAGELRRLALAEEG